MALALASQSSREALSPAKQLTEAVDDFQRILTEDQRTALKKIKSIPDADAVLVFTAELDASQQHRRRSIATRLHSVLESVQQFSAVIDTFVSSNPEIAALVWGSVKLTIQVRCPAAVDAKPLTRTRLHSTSHRTMRCFLTSSWVSRRTVHGMPSTKSCIQTRSGFRQPCATSTLLLSVAASMRWRLLNEIVCRADAVYLD